MSPSTERHDGREHDDQMSSKETAVATVERKDDIMTALISWLRSFPHLSDIEANEGLVDCRWLDSPTVARCVLQAAEEIFSHNPAKSLTLDDSHDAWGHVHSLVHMNMSQFIAANTSKDEIVTEIRRKLLSAMLCHAVSENCSLRETYIARIMELSKDIQRSLMLIIERGMQNADETKHSTRITGSEGESADHGSDGRNNVGTPKDATSRRCRDEDSPESTTGYTPQRKKRQPTSQSPPSAQKTNPDFGKANDGMLFSPGTQGLMMNHMEKEMEELREQNLFLKRELEIARHHETGLSEQLGETELKHRAETMKIESDAINREKELSDLHVEEITALQTELRQLRDCSQEASDAKEELASLRDEIDVLQHARDKLASTEEQLRKCKVKLQQMGDAKAALAREEEAHSASVTKCLKLENDLNALQPLRRQLDDYKARAADAEVKLASCQEDLRRFKKASETLKGTNKELQKGAMMQQVETEEMRRRLMEDGDTMNSQNGNAVGEGMSELNPELKEEILSLRNENACLKAFASKRENDSVQMLEEELDRCKTVSDRFKEQFLSTKVNLEETQRSLVECEGRESSLRIEVAKWTEKAANFEKKLQEECLFREEALKEVEIGAQAMKKSLIEKAREERASLEKKSKKLLNEERRNSEQKLAKATHDKKALEKKSEKDLADLREQSSAAMKASRERWQRRIDDTEKEHKSTIEQLTKVASEEREKLIGMGKKMIQDVKSENQTKLADMEAKHKVMVDDMKRSRSKYQEQYEEYEEKAKAQISSYKHKLLISTGKINDLTRQLDKLQETRKKIEREKVALQGENDRFRRQLGSRYGADSKNQSQFEQLQREYNLLVEAHKALRQREHSTISYSPHLDQNQLVPHPSDGSDLNMSQYSGGGGGNVSNSTLSQLRVEYEETIQALHDEKRELVMRNSSAITEAQKAEQRSWELEEELTMVKKEITSLKLALERAERNAPSLEPMEPTQNVRQHTATSPEKKKSKDVLTSPGGTGLGTLESEHPFNVDNTKENESKRKHSIESSPNGENILMERKIPYQAEGTNRPPKRRSPFSKLLPNSGARASEQRFSGAEDFKTRSARSKRSPSAKSAVSKGTGAHNVPTLMEHTKVGGNTGSDGPQECNVN